VVCWLRVRVSITVTHSHVTHQRSTPDTLRLPACHRSGPGSLLGRRPRLCACAWERCPADGDKPPAGERRLPWLAKRTCSSRQVVSVCWRACRRAGPAHAQPQEGAGSSGSCAASDQH
jgi:hypothetical protein